METSGRDCPRLPQYKHVINQRSSEVWEVLGQVKAEFTTYGKLIEKVKTKLDEASRTIDDDLARRTRVINRKLKNVEVLPSADAVPLLAAEPNGVIESEVEEVA